LYAESTTPVTKGIYLRKREDLILRIEARSPNDDEGTYQLFFGGSFEPVVGGPEIAENETPGPGGNTGGDRKTKRVSSVGARLPEPERPVTEEVAAAPTPSPEITPTPTEKTEEPKPEKPKPAPKTRTTIPANTARNRRPTTRRTPPAKPKPEETASDESNKPEETKNSEETEAPKPKSPATRTPARRGTAAANRTAKAKTEKPEEPAAAPEPEIGPRLVIETSDGTLINRSMSTIRRVIVENGQVVVTARDGKIDRIPLANVVRMSIAQ
jgi:hypothetical protein